MFYYFLGKIRDVTLLKIIENVILDNSERKYLQTLHNKADSS